MAVITERSENDVILKCLTKKELADQYGVTERTILNWCQRLGIASDGGIMTPKQLVLLYLEKGIPGTIEQNLNFFKDQAYAWCKN